MNLLGALLVVALGVAVALVRPRTRANDAFAVFASAFGAQFALTNVLNMAEISVEGVWVWVRLVIRLLAVAGLVALVLRFPRDVGRDERHLLILPAAVWGALLVVYLAVPLGRLVSGDGAATLGETVWLVIRRNFWIMFSALFFGLFVLARRFPTAASDRTRTQYALLSSALLLYAGFAAGSGVDTLREQSLLSSDAITAAFYAAYLLALIFLSGLWLRNTARAEAPRLSRNVALLALIMPLVGLAYTAAGLDVGGLGIVRTLAVAVLAYAVVRHQLFGIDVKVRWTISKTTVAATFIAVFFIVSESAQEIFSGFVSPLLGILAAGLLVFAIAPLQRAADRIAAKAVPVASGPLEADPGALQDYRTAYRAAAKDGRISRQDELALARLADRLGLGAEAAIAIRQELESEHATIKGSGKPFKRRR